MDAMMYLDDNFRLNRFKAQEWGIERSMEGVILELNYQEGKKHGNDRK